MNEPFLTPSPVFLDQTFPRSLAELQSAAASLGSLQQAFMGGLCRFIIADPLRDFLELFEWNQDAQRMPLLRDLHVGLSALILDPRTVVISPPASETVHPIPRSCVDSGFIAEWAQYMGRLLAYHDEFIPRGYCIGIACAFGFAGGPCDTYADPELRAFPIVDETFNEGDVLRSPAEYRVPRNVAAATIRKDDVLAHWDAIPNATHLEETDGDSHRKLRFPESHWTLDLNWDSIDPRLIGDLALHAKLETPVLKFVLLRGEMPPVRQLFPPPN